MLAVSVRELRARLPHYVRVAKAGGVVLVPEHGRVIAAESSAVLDCPLGGSRGEDLRHAL